VASALVLPHGANCFGRASSGTGGPPWASLALIGKEAAEIGFASVRAGPDPSGRLDIAATI